MRSHPGRTQQRTVVPLQGEAVAVGQVDHRRDEPRVVGARGFGAVHIGRGRRLAPAPREVGIVATHVGHAPAVGVAEAGKSGRPRQPHHRTAAGGDSDVEGEVTGIFAAEGLQREGVVGAGIQRRQREGCLGGIPQRVDVRARHAQAVVVRIGRRLRQLDARGAIVRHPHRRCRSAGTCRRVGCKHIPAAPGGEILHGVAQTAVAVEAHRPLGGEVEEDDILVRTVARGGHAVL